jgi:hypothetical protein
MLQGCGAQESTTSLSFMDRLPLIGNNCTGDLYQVTGGSTPNVAWNAANKVVTKVGNVSFSFAGSGIGAMQYTINGVTGTRAISRQAF